MEPYNLEHELAFIAGLGTWSIVKTPRRELLRNYIAALPTRLRGINGREMLTVEERRALRQRALILLAAH